MAGGGAKRVVKEYFPRKTHSLAGRTTQSSIPYPVGCYISNRSVSQHNVGIGKSRQQGRQLLRRPQIVPFQNRNELAAAETERAVVRMCQRFNSLVLLVHVLNSRVLKTVDDFGSPIRGTIVDGNQFPVLIGLLQNTFNARADVLLVVECRCNDAD